MRMIEKLDSPEEIIDEVIRENNEFDLTEFFLQNVGEFSIMDYGLYVVTPKQSFYCYSRDKHAYAMCNILYALYSDYNQLYRENDGRWELVTTKLGVIAVQLMSKYYLVMQVPNVISQFQYDKLVCFYNDMEEINKKLIAGGEHKVHVGCIFPLMNKSMDLDEAILFLKDKIIQQDTDEVMIDFDSPKVKTLNYNRISVD